MRLHHLTITAFGPFAGTVRVDFDDLSGAGLFLMTGPTGAGKTSVLDAVCFALYSDVPGGRGQSKRLRSDHAPVDRAPQVVLECTLAGRRLRIARSPAWQRPKRRGVGTTTEQAHVTVSERLDGRWQPVTTRIDEAGHLLGDLLGLTLSQFTQVAMLPQGEFQAFLRARADERQTLLERLFRTERFRLVEQWLAERRRQCAREVERLEQETSRLLSRVGEAVETEPPLDETGRPASALAVSAWLSDHDAQVSTALARETDRVASTGSQRDAAAQDLAAARELHADRLRWHQASEAHARLQAEADTVAEARTRLAAGHRAAPVWPVARIADEAVVTSERLTAAAERAVELAIALDDLPDTEAVDLATLRGRRDVAQRAALDAQRLLPLQRERTDLEELATKEAERSAALSERADDLDKAVEALPVALQDAETVVAHTRAAALALPSLHSDVARLERQAEAAGRLESLAAESSELREARSETATQVHSAKERWLDLREQRLAGMAAEMAGGLVVGGSCPVCGSCDHPQPASAAPDAPDAARERTARRAVDNAEAALTAIDDRVRSVESALAAARAGAEGRSPAEVTSLLEATRGRLRAVSEQAAQVPAAEAGRDRVREELESARSEAADVRRQLAVIASRSETRVARITEITGQIDGALSEHGHATLAELQRANEAVVAACDDAVASLEAMASARDEAERRVGELSAAIGGAGFTDRAALDAALLDPAELEGLDEVVRRHEQSLAAVEATLADPDVMAAAAAEAPDLAMLTARADTARQDAGRAEQQHALLTRRLARLRDLTAQIETMERALTPLRDEHATVVALAAFAEGRSADNRLAMRLSAYAVAYRLGQVVDAANERLERMSDQRYQLEHSVVRASGDRRGGLAILVRDAWSGDTREPATLSGGETFIVSLSLALGLADVVTHEAAGAELGTLFVDEGFGSLDPETLDHVLDTLDQLRSGGRVVGIVSHVAEVRARIPARLEVAKAQEGSTLSQHSGIA